MLGIYIIGGEGGGMINWLGTIVYLGMGGLRAIYFPLVFLVLVMEVRKLGGQG